MHKVTKPVGVELRLNPELTESRAQNFLASFLFHMKSPGVALITKSSQSRFIIITL